jgi:hypothetical protein
VCGLVPENTKYSSFLLVRNSFRRGNINQESENTQMMCEEYVRWLLSQSFSSVWDEKLRREENVEKGRARMWGKMTIQGYAHG